MLTPPPERQPSPPPLCSNLLEKTTDVVIKAAKMGDLVLVSPPWVYCRLIIPLCVCVCPLSCCSWGWYGIEQLLLLPFSFPNLLFLLLLLLFDQYIYICDGNNIIDRPSCVYSYASYTVKGTRCCRSMPRDRRRCIMALGTATRTLCGTSSRTPPKPSSTSWTMKRE